MTPTTEDARPLLLISLCLLALVVGIVTGLGSVAFRALIACVHNLLFLGHWSFYYDSSVFHPAAPMGLCNGERGRAHARPRCRSVFARQHDGQNPQGLGRIARLVAAHVVAGAEAGPVVIVDLPEDPLTVILETAEVVFPVWVVASGEAVGSYHTLGKTVAIKPRSRMPLVITFLPRLAPAGSPPPVDLRKRSFNSAMRFVLLFLMMLLPWLIGRVIATCQEELAPC